MDYILQYTLDIRHIKGEENIPADALSRGINSFQLEPCIDIHTFCREQEKDEYPQQEKNPALLLVKISYTNNAEKIICDKSTGKLRLYVPASLCKDIFTAVHSLLHPGTNVSVHLLTDRFVWPQIKADMRAMTKTCLKCQWDKWVNSPAPDERFKPVHIDITGPLPICEGHKYLLTYVNRFSRWCEALLMLDMSAYTTARTFLAGWVARYNMPERVMTDRGRQFESELFRKWSQLLGTQNIHTTAYHPQANGIMERLHCSLKAFLHAELTSTKWLEHLPLIHLELRTTVKKELNYSVTEGIWYGTRF